MEQTQSKKRLGALPLALCGLFTALVAIGAFLQIPVPYFDYFTLQFFFVVLAGMLLGRSYGALSVGVYVLLGLAGVPIFAAGGGIGYVVRPSFGYLLGFIAAAFVTGWLTQRSKTKSFAACLGAALGGFAATYLIGLTYKYIILNFVSGTPATWLVVLLSCFPLDMPGDLLLCAAAAFVGSRMHKALKGRLPSC